MTRGEIDGENLRVDLVGLDRVPAFQTSLVGPPAPVRGAALAPDEARRFFHGLKLPGTSIPGIITAGSFYDGNWLFYDVHDASKAVKIDLDHEHYAALIVEVADPEATVRTLIDALAGRSGGNSQP